MTCELFLDGSDFHVMNSGKYEKGWIEIKIVFFTVRIEWIWKLNIDKTIEEKNQNIHNLPISAYRKDVGDAVLLEDFMSVYELRWDCVEGKVFWEIGCYEEAENAKSPVQAFLTTPQYLSSQKKQTKYIPIISIMLEISLVECPNKTKFCLDIQIITSSISDLREFVRKNECFQHSRGWMARRGTSNYLDF